MGRNVTSQPGGVTRVSTTNSDHLSHGGTRDRDFKDGVQQNEIHNTPDGKSHEHNVDHSIPGPSAGSIKR